MIIDDDIRAIVSRIENAGHVSEYDVTNLVHRLAINCVASKRDLSVSAGDDPFPAYPIDHDGYAVSFDPLTDEAGFTDAWRRYGFVVGKAILSQDQCKQARDEIKARFRALSHETCDMDRPDTWHNMPRDANGTPVLSRGFLEIYHDDVLAQLRQNVRAYIHHVLIWGRPDLWTTFDRIGVKLPHHEESVALPLHVDQNPNIHPGFKTVQGVMALTDCPARRGTFMGVPGSRAFFHHYGAMAKNAGEYVELDQSTPIAATFRRHAQAIPLRAGDFVSWHSGTTHANTENMSDETRMVAYISAGPAQRYSVNAHIARANAFVDGTGSNVRDAMMHASKKPRFTDPAAIARIRKPERLTPLGKLLYGMNAYEPNLPTPAP